MSDNDLIIEHEEFRFPLDFQRLIKREIDKFISSDYDSNIDKDWDKNEFPENNEILFFELFAEIYSRPFVKAPSSAWYSLLDFIFPLLLEDKYYSYGNVVLEIEEEGEDVIPIVSSAKRSNYVPYKEGSLNALKAQFDYFDPTSMIIMKSKAHPSEYNKKVTKATKQNRKIKEKKKRASPKPSAKSVRMRKKVEKPEPKKIPKVRIVEAVKDVEGVVGSPISFKYTKKEEGEPEVEIKVKKTRAPRKVKKIEITPIKEVMEEIIEVKEKKPRAPRKKKEPVSETKVKKPRAPRKPKAKKSDSEPKRVQYKGSKLRGGFRRPTETEAIDKNHLTYWGLKEVNQTHRAKILGT